MSNVANTKVIQRLQVLANGLVGSNSAAGFKGRVEFMSLAIKHDLVDDIASYSLWDAGYEGLGERSVDTCFEMGDSEEVIAELIKKARAEGFISAVSGFAGSCFERWCSYADRQASLAF